MKEVVQLTPDLFLEDSATCPSLKLFDSPFYHPFNMQNYLAHGMNAHDDNKRGDAHLQQDYYCDNVEYFGK